MLLFPDYRIQRTPNEARSRRLDVSQRPPFPHRAAHELERASSPRPTQRPLERGPSKQQQQRNRLETLAHATAREDRHREPVRPSTPRELSYPNVSCLRNGGRFDIVAAESRVL